MGKPKSFLLFGDIIRLVRHGKVKWARKDRLRCEIRDSYEILFGKPEVMRLIGETKMCMIRYGLNYW
jgi:hypothetical protein